MCFVGDVKWVIKDQGRSLEVDVMLLAIALILGLIPFEAHLLYIHYCTDKVLVHRTARHRLGLQLYLSPQAQTA